MNPLIPKQEAEKAASKKAHQKYKSWNDDRTLPYLSGYIDATNAAKRKIQRGCSYVGEISGNVARNNIAD